MMNTLCTDLLERVAYRLFVRNGYLLLLLTIPLIMLGCQQPQTNDDLSKYPAGAEAKEAPMLAHLVAQGELPPSMSASPRIRSLPHTSTTGTKSPESMAAPGTAFTQIHG